MDDYTYTERFMGRVDSSLIGLLILLDIMPGEHIEWTVADRDAEGRATLEECGIQTRPATKGVLAGIEAVQKRLRPAGDGRPRLFIVKNCTVSRDPRLIELKSQPARRKRLGRMFGH